jgi:hypothetical protein
MFRRSYILALALACLIGIPAFAASNPQGEPAHPEIGSLDDILAAFDNGDLSLNDLRRMGLSVFSTPFNSFDGMGDGPFDPSEYDEDGSTLALGHRPTLQGNGTLLRVNGLDAQSCNECHTIVSNATRPPTLGIAGVGGMVQNAIIMPSLIDVADSFDDRVVFQSGHDPNLPLEFDGVADFSGRFANPPFLFGGGGVELLAKEMTADLQGLLAQARTSPAGTVTVLDTHGTHYGTITTVDSAGNVELDVEGIGYEDNSEHTAEEVLVVRPFGRKGEAFSMRDFDRGAMQFHFGIQPVEVVGEGEDADHDGTSDEVTVAEMSMLHIFDVTNPPPFIGSLSLANWRGFATFATIGCANCHHPVMITNGRKVPLASPEVPTDPSQNVYMEINLPHVGFVPVPGAGVAVPLFADLKRHHMGPRLAETFERGDLANDEFTTARLWGISGTAPYLHDGRATTLYKAIDFHGGEAQSARDAFIGLSTKKQRELIGFLGKLKTPNHPDEELLPLE